MSQTHAPAQDGAEDARIVEEHHITGPHGEDEIEGIDDRGRQWYHLRPEPRRRTDFMGFNSTWWMAVGWVIVFLLVVYPFPWWW
jgi:hypothetical protein